MIITTANIGRGVSAKEAQANIRLIHKQQPRSLIGWQEIDGADTPNEHGILKDVFSSRYQHAGFKTAIPITSPLSWKIKRQQVTPTMDALPPVGGARKIVEAVVENIVNHKRKVAILNTHMTRTPPGNTKAERGWKEHFDILQKRVEHYLNYDIPVVFTGDVNKVMFPKIHPRQVTVINAHVDRIIVVPTKSWQWQIGDTGSIPLSIDIHNAHWAKIQLIRKEV